MEKVKVKRTYATPKKINHIDNDGNIISTYNSAMDAAENLGVSSSNIHLVCKGTYKQTGGYKFKYTLQT